MAATESFTLTEVARRLRVPQHRLIHLCEKGVVVPEVHDATGRGSSRVFSPLNYLELAVALRLRDMLIPVNVVRGIVHVLRTFGQQLETGSRGPSLVEQLRQPESPEIRIILSDGQLVYFALYGQRDSPRLFGGIPLKSLTDNAASGAPESHHLAADRGGDAREFGGPEGSHFARMELNVNAVARSLQLD
jgi:DNA-binding transcriptional MerR regulator